MIWSRAFHMRGHRVSVAALDGPNDLMTYLNIVAVAGGEAVAGPVEAGAAVDGSTPPSAANGTLLLPAPEGAAPEVIPTAGAYSAREDFLQKMEDEGQISFKYVLNDGQPHNSIWCDHGVLGFRRLRSTG